MAKQRILVTGATGFVGSWTLRYWRATHPEVEVWATSDRPLPPDLIVEDYRRLDLRDRDAVREYIDLCRPTSVIHLGGLIGNASLADHLAVNVVGTENLYKALAERGPAPKLRIVQASSAATYGLIRPDDLPVTEEQPPRPVSAYAISKVAQDHLAMAIGRSEGLEIVRACIFNVLGPGQPDSLVPAAFIKQLVEVRSGSRDRLQVGNTTPRRDFLDVRDVPPAFDALLARGEPGQAYNLASGKDLSIQEVLDLLLHVTGLDVPIEVDAARVRPVEVPLVRAAVAKITGATDWRPRIPLEQSLEDMWQERISAPA